MSSNLHNCTLKTGFPGGSVIKKLPANAGDIRDAGSTSGSWKRLVTINSVTLSVLAMESIPAIKQTLIITNLPHLWQVSINRFTIQTYYELILSVNMYSFNFQYGQCNNTLYKQNLGSEKWLFT